MSKNSKKDSSIEGVFVPVIEGFSEILNEKIGLGVNYLAKSLSIPIGGRKNRNEYLKLTTPMVRSVEQTTDESALGFAVNYNRAYPLKYLDTSKHVFIVGASGWGKTNLLNILITNAINKGQTVVFIDPKGSRESIKDFINICQRLNKSYHIFSEYHPEARPFNPLADMTNTQRIELIMRSFDWGDKPNQYYLNEASRALVEVFKKIAPDQDRCKVDLHDVLNELKTTHNKEETSGLITQLELLLTSDFGKCFKDNHDARTMTLKSAWEEKSCVYIGCSTQGYARIARTVGKMFVSSMMNLSYQIGRDYSDSHEAMKNGLGLFIDEAGSVLFSDFIDLVNKCRSSGINIYTAIQSYSDIEMIGGGEVLMKQLFESYSTWLIQRQSNPENAEKLASAFGTYLSQKFTIATEDGNDSGKGTTREGYEYYCHPDILKNIRVGQTLLLSHSPRDHSLINVRNFRESSFCKKDTIHTPITESKYKQNMDQITLGGK